MRLLHVIASLDPRDGGPVQWVKSLHRELAGRGHHSAAVSLDAPDAPFLADLPMPCHAVGPGLGRYALRPAAVARIRDLARAHDAVIVEGLWQFPGLATHLALRPPATPYFVFAHGMLDPWFRQAYPLKHLKKLIYWRCAEARVLRDATAVLFTNDEEARLARTTFPHAAWRPAIVRFGIEDGPADGERLRQRFFAEHPALAGRRLVTFLGRLHEKKGYDLLLRAFARVRDDDPRLHLLFIGPADPPTAARIAGLIERAGLRDRVTRIDFLSGESKWGALHASEVFCLPSHQENFGIAVVEALACAVPVLISDKINIHPVIAACGAGIVGPDTEDGALGCLRAWLDADEARRSRMRTAARTCFETSFHIRAAADDLLAIVGEAGGSRGPARTGGGHDR